MNFLGYAVISVLVSALIIFWVIFVFRFLVWYFNASKKAKEVKRIDAEITKKGTVLRVVPKNNAYDAYFIVRDVDGIMIFGRLVITPRAPEGCSIKSSEFDGNNHILVHYVDGGISRTYIGDPQLVDYPQAQLVVETTDLV